MSIGKGPIGGGLIKRVEQWFRGFFLYGLVGRFETEKHYLDELFLLGLFGKTIGFPHLFNFYHLRLLPYQIKKLDLWRRRSLRERDFFDLIRE